MVNMHIVRNFRCEEGFINKGEVGKLFRNNAENIDLCFGEKFLEEDAGHIAEVSVAPNADYIAPLVGYFIKT